MVEIITDLEIQLLRRLLDRLESQKKPIKKKFSTNKEMEEKYKMKFQHSESKKKK